MRFVILASVVALGFVSGADACWHKNKTVACDAPVVTSPCDVVQPVGQAVVVERVIEPCAAIVEHCVPKKKFKLFGGLGGCLAKKRAACTPVTPPCAPADPCVPITEVKAVKSVKTVTTTTVTTTTICK